MTVWHTPVFFRHRLNFIRVEPSTGEMGKVLCSRPFTLSLLWTEDAFASHYISPWIAPTHKTPLSMVVGKGSLVKVVNVQTGYFRVLSSTPLRLQTIHLLCVCVCVQSHPFVCDANLMTTKDFAAWVERIIETNKILKQSEAKN